MKVIPFDGKRRSPRALRCEATSDASSILRQIAGCTSPSLAGVLALVLPLLGCGDIGSGQARDDANTAFVRDVMGLVRSSYVDPVSGHELMVHALDGMVDGLDPHSRYLDQGEYQNLRDEFDGESSGLGLDVEVDGVPTIVSAIADSPAERAGLRPGDVILRLNGSPTADMSPARIHRLLRGAPGSKVVLTVMRSDGPPVDVTLVGAVTRTGSVVSDLRDGRIAYVRVPSFNERTQEELVGAIHRLRGQAGGILEGFVLDLRDNPGGLVDAAADVCSDFLDGGPVVRLRGRSSADNDVYMAKPRGDRLRGAPMVVLINDGSASASEIVAAALQDRDRAIIMGTRSFGKGVVQTIFPLGGRGALDLTTDRYFTPSGRSIEGVGITPDIVVEPLPRELDGKAVAYRESDLLRAPPNNDVIGAKGGSADGPATDVQPVELSINPAVIGTPEDHQLRAALAYLHDLRRGYPAIGRSTARQ